MAELGHGVGSIPSTASDEATQNANLPTAAQKAALDANASLSATNFAVSANRTINGLPLTADIVINTTTAGLASSYLFCEDVIFAGTTPAWHELEKESDGGTVGSHTATTTSYTELDRYVTEALATTIVPEGIWRFNLFAKMSGQSGQLRAQIYRVDSAGAIVGGVLGTAESAVFTNTAVVSIPLSVYIAEQTGWAVTDRIGVVLSGKKIGAPAATLTFYHNASSGWLSEMVSPLALLHNQMAGLAEGDYRHVTADMRGAFDAASLALSPTNPPVVGRQTITAGEALTAFNVVYLDSADSGKAKKAINSGTTLQADAFGIVPSSIDNAATGVVVTRGPITNVSWTWTPGGEVYVGATAGAMTQTQPSGGAIAKPIGKATSATTIDVDPDTGWTT